MRAWYFDKNASNPREACVLPTSKAVTTTQLEKLGLQVIRFDADNYDNDDEFNKFKSLNKYDYQGTLHLDIKTLF